MQRHAGTLPKRYGPGGQRRSATSRLLQMSSIGGNTAAVAAAAAYAMAAAGNNQLDRSHVMMQHQQQQQHHHQQQQGIPLPQQQPPPQHHQVPVVTHSGNVIQLARTTPISPESVRTVNDGADNSRSPISLVGSMNGSTSITQRPPLSQQQSIISNGKSKVNCMKESRE